MLAGYCVDLEVLLDIAANLTMRLNSSQKVSRDAHASGLNDQL